MSVCDTFLCKEHANFQFLTNKLYYLKVIKLNVTQGCIKFGYFSTEDILNLLMHQSLYDVVGCAPRNISFYSYTYLL